MHALNDQLLQLLVESGGLSAAFLTSSLTVYRVYHQDEPYTCLTRRGHGQQDSPSVGDVSWPHGLLRAVPPRSRFVCSDWRGADGQLGAAYACCQACLALCMRGKESRMGTRQLTTGLLAWSKIARVCVATQGGERLPARAED